MPVLHLFRIPLLLLAAWLICGTTAQAQPRVDGFFKQAGQVDVVLGGGAEFADRYFAGTNNIPVGRTIYNGNAFVAAGLTNRLNINLAAAYVAINDVRSAQDGTLLLKYNLMSRSIQTTTWALGIAGAFSGNLADYRTEGLSATGQQAKVIEGRPFLHGEFSNSWFMTVQAAYQYKYDPVPNAVNASLKIGRATAKWYYDFWYDHQTSFGGLDYRGTPAPSTFRELGVGYHRFGATLFKPLGAHFGVAVGSSYTPIGRNIGQGLGINGSLIFRGN